MMRRALLMAGMLLRAASAVAGAQPPAPPPPTVVVRGEGEVRAAPDVAFVTIGAEFRAATPKEAQASRPRP